MVLFYKYIFKYSYYDFLNTLSICIKLSYFLFNGINTFNCNSYINYFILFNILPLLLHNMLTKKSV